MNPSTVSLHEIIRLQDLSSYEILDTAPENDYDGIVELAAMICGCSASLISFIDRDRQWFKAKMGVNGHEAALETTICSRTIQQDDVLIVNNAIEDVRFREHPSVSGGFHLRFYAGVPILSSKGNKLGTLCVIDKRPKTLLPKQAEALKILSTQVSRLLELRVKNKLLENLLQERD